MRAKATAVTNVHTLPNQLPREKWAKRIAAAWQKQVPSIFEVGALLESAKAELKHGEWMTLVKNELPFHRATAHKLIQVATCDHLRDVAHVQHLPANWGTLHELTKLTEKQFNDGIKSGAINNRMQRKHVKALRGDEEKNAIVKPKQSNVKDFDVLCSEFAFSIEHTAKGMTKEQRSEFLILLRGVTNSLLEKEAGHG